jgi:hypothetical protein
MDFWRQALLHKCCFTASYSRIDSCYNAGKRIGGLILSQNLRTENDRFQNLNIWLTSLTSVSPAGFKTPAHRRSPEHVEADTTLKSASFLQVRVCPHKLAISSSPNGDLSRKISLLGASSAKRKNAGRMNARQVNRSYPVISYFQDTTRNFNTIIPFEFGQCKNDGYWFLNDYLNFFFLEI